MSALRNLAAALLLCGVAARAQQPERITFPDAVYTRLDADRTTAAAVVDSTTTPPTVSSVSRTVQPRDSWTANLQLVVPLVAPQRWVQWGHASEQVDVARLSAEDVRRQVAVITARSSRTRRRGCRRARATGWTWCARARSWPLRSRRCRPP